MTEMSGEMVETEKVNSDIVVKWGKRKKIDDGNEKKKEKRV